MMVAGRDLSGFWDVYSFHLRRPHIHNLLEKYRIGTLSKDDAKKSQKLSKSFRSYYTNEPSRPFARDNHIMASDHPWNSEPLPFLLTDSFLTPNEVFFIRNHNSVPQIDLNEWDLTIELPGNSLSLSLSVCVRALFVCDWAHQRKTTHIAQGSDTCLPFSPPVNALLSLSLSLSLSLPPSSRHKRTQTTEK